jgi:hypothetical protein
VPAAAVAAEAGSTDGVDGLSTTPVAPLPIRPLVDHWSARSLPAIRASLPAVNERPDDVPASAPGQPAANLSSGWTRAADAGVAVGRVSQDAGVATAGFFRKFGQRIAGSF